MSELILLSDYFMKADDENYKFIEGQGNYKLKKRKKWNINHEGSTKNRINFKQLIINPKLIKFIFLIY